MIRPGIASLGFIALGLAGTPALAGTVSVNCASAKIQAAIDAAPAGTPLVVNVSGACLENLTVPYGKQVNLVGLSGSSLKPKNATAPVIVNNGWLTLSTMNVQSAGTAASLIQTLFGRLEITASTLAAPKVVDMLDISNNASLRVFNSSITGGTATTIALSTGSVGVVVADASVPYIGSAPVSTISAGNTTGSAIWCGATAGVRLRALAGTIAGAIRVTNSMNGLDANGCTAEIQNKTGVADNVTISGMTGNGVFARNSRLSFMGVRIMSNTVSGVVLTESNLLLTASKIYGSGANDIAAGYGSQVLFNWGPSPNALPDVNKAPYDSLACMANTEISIPKPNLVQDIGNNYAASGCVKTY